MSAVPISRGQIELNVPLARLNTWRVGGPARRLYRPADVEDLAQFLAHLPADEPLFWLGFGSNILVRDGGIKATVISLRERLTAISRTQEGYFRAEAGAPCAKVARLGADEGLAGLEFFAGIPGSVGGALAMNAGAFGQATWECVAAVEVIDRMGRVSIRTPESYRIAYREVQGPADEWFVAAQFKLRFDDRLKIHARISSLVANRNASQPMGIASCGSVFRNPEGHHAAQLIERAGLKGMTCGGARVSERHANFIVNESGATAADIESLILRVQTLVLERCGVVLLPEVRIVGEAP